SGAQIERSSMEKQLEILKALAHPIRLGIVHTLAQCETKCVCEIQEIQKEVSQSNLSQHLKILREADIVTCEKVGGWVHYALKNRGIMNILKSLEEL
ncbi:MAG: ArsR/SmtB family transcription factor, partial [Cetobacterium sp.]